MSHNLGIRYSNVSENLKKLEGGEKSQPGVRGKRKFVELDAKLRQRDRSGAWRPEADLTVRIQGESRVMARAGRTARKDLWGRHPTGTLKSKEQSEARKVIDR